ncbi:MAG: hypothetical protein H5T61_08575 [Thermoflexales bacterium]|nr:hypothetical protein [Thermoflexales bacterium]
MKAAPAPLPPGILSDLLHQTAFNLCAALAGSWDGPVVLRSGDPFYAAELALRLETFLQTERSTRRPMLIWADPCVADLPEIADLLDDFPLGSGVLLLLVRRRRGSDGPDASGVAQDLSCAPRIVRTETGQRALWPKEVLDWLAARGFREEVGYGIGGSDYRFWSRLAYLAERLGQEDRADRFRARAQAALLVWGKRVPAAILTLILTVRRNG